MSVVFDVSSLRIRKFRGQLDGELAKFNQYSWQIFHVLEELHSLENIVLYSKYGYEPF